MPPFQPNACVPVPAPTLPSCTAPLVAALAAPSSTCCGPHVLAANVVQAAVVGLADQRVHRSHVLVARLIERPAHEAFHRRRRRSACWSARSASRSCRAHRPASSRRACRTRCRRTRRRAPCPGTRCRACGTITVTPVRTLSPSISVACPTRHAGDVGDRVERPRREHAGRQPRSRARGRAASCASTRWRNDHATTSAHASAPGTSTQHLAPGT